VAPVGAADGTLFDFMINQNTFSFEFFPPKTSEGAVKLRGVWQTLGALNPLFFSVTFGAGGSTREGTLATVQSLCADALTAAPHLSCVGATPALVRELLDAYRAMGIRRVVALRGDLPSGTGPSGAGALRYASDLVSFVREHSNDWFHIEVAAYPEFHPQAKSAKEDLAAFANKVKAGANSAITQFFFNADAYLKFVEDVGKLGVTVPIVPGIMPITNYMQLKGFAEKAAIDMPRWIEERLRGYGDDSASIRAFGLDVTTALCERLLREGAPGLHFYTMNQAQASAEIWSRLSLSDRSIRKQVNAA
jgi:methylenetetrahydrofolate reductase (NADPH)